MFKIKITTRHYAVASKNAEIVEELIKAGANVNATCKMGGTLYITP